MLSIFGKIDPVNHLKVIKMNNLAQKTDYVKHGNLHHFPHADCQDFLARKVANEPVFLFSPGQLGITARRFLAKFPGEVSYAVKANPDPMILKSLWSNGIRSFDVASPGEIELINSLFPAPVMHYNNPVKSSQMVEDAYYVHGVRSFVIDDQAGLDQLTSLAAHDLEITVRFKLPHQSAAYDFGSKFGANPDQAINLLKAAACTGAKCSLTFHPGSQCTDPLMYGRYIRCAASITKSAEVDLYRLNVGGGFPVQYPGDNVDQVETFLDSIESAVKSCFGTRRPQLLCEPGRAMVAASCSLLTRVIHVRENGDVFINDGVYGGFQEQAIMSCRLPVKVYRESKLIAAGSSLEEIPRTVYGPTCDPVDRLSPAMMLPADIRPGDHIEFGFMGAYGSATSTRFNGFVPAEYVQVQNGFFGPV